MNDDQNEMPAAPDIAELYRLPEALHPELSDHFRDGPAGKMIHHPLLVTVLTIPGHHRADNVIYRHRKERAEQFWRERDWSAYIAIHERPYRAKALQRILVEGPLSLGLPATWRLIKWVWIDSENVDEHDAFWTAIWAKAKMELTLDQKEQSAFDDLPDIIDIWHGLERSDIERLGFSWTTDQGVAEWFAQRFARTHGRPAYLATGAVHKKHVKAFLLARGEQEIIVFPENVDRLAVVRYPD